MRKIYIDKAERVDSYSLLEEVKGDYKIVQRFGNMEELIDYLRGDNPYAAGLRKRGKKGRRVRVNIFTNNLDWQVANNLRVKLEQAGFNAREVIKPEESKKQD